MSFLRSALFLSLLCASVGSAQELKTLSGKNVKGSLKAITADAIIMNGADGDVSTPLSQVLALDVTAPPRAVIDRHYEIHLLDDTVLAAKDIAYVGKDIQVTLLSGASLKVPLSVVVSLLKDAQDKSISKQFAFLSKTKLRADRILIFKDGELNALDGTLGDVDANGKSIEFKRGEGAAIYAKLEVLQGMIFVRTEVPKESAICKVIDIDGDTVLASKLAYEGNTLTATTPAGALVTLKGEALARLDFNLGRLTYLSDLEPTKLSENAFFGGFPAYRRDVNQDGRPIVLLDKPYAKGITIEGAAVVEFNLAGKFKDFKAFVGADIRAAEGGLAKTVVTIYCDGAKRETVLVVPTELRPIAVNVNDVATLRIVVEGPNFTGLASYVTLAEARVSQ